jgi:type II secretory pathway component PulF
MFGKHKTDLKIRRAAWQFKSLRADFYLDLAASMKANPGQPLTQMLANQGSRYKKEPAGVLCRYWLEQMEHTGTFASAVEGTVPNEDMTVLYISEASGDLRAGFDKLGRSVAGMNACRSANLKTLATALFLLVLLHFFFAIEAFVILPKIEKSMKGIVDVSKMGGVVKVLFTGAEMVRSWWWLWLGTVFGGSMLTKWALKNYVGRFRPWLDDNILPFQMARDFNGSSFFVTIGAITAHSAGTAVVQLHEALDKMSEHAYPWLRWHIQMIQENLHLRPNSKGEIFDTGIANRKAFYRILDIADYAEVNVMLNRVGDIILETAPKEMAARATIVRYVLFIICLSLIIGIAGSTGSMVDAFRAQAQMNMLH